MSRDIHSKYWDEELETLPRAELEKRQLADLQESVPAVETNGRKVFVPPDTDAKQVKAPFHFSHDSVLLLP